MSLTRLKTLLQCSHHGRFLHTLNRRSLMTSSTIFLGRKTPEEEEEDPNKPLVYTQSKASTMTVGTSFGDKHKRPIKKVLPICITGIALLVWMYTREETEIDQKLGSNLPKHLPGLFEETEVENPEKEVITR